MLTDQTECVLEMLFNAIICGTNIPYTEKLFIEFKEKMLNKCRGYCWNYFLVRDSKEIFKDFIKEHSYKGVL